MAKFDADVTVRMNPDKGTETLVAIADMTNPEYGFSHPDPSVVADVYRKRLTKIHRLAADALEVKPQPDTVTHEERMRRALAEMRNGKILILPDSVKPVVSVTESFATVEADRLKIKIGTLEIESGLAVHGAKITADGRPFPVPFRSILISGEVRGAWKIEVGLVPVPVAKGTSSHHGPDDVQPDKIL